MYAASVNATFERQVKPFIPGRGADGEEGK
jgi:hypothetical protein